CLSLIFTVFFSLLLNAQAGQAVAALKILPAPKEVRLGEGFFTVSSTTRILVDVRHFSEDRTAAEMLSQEILEQAALEVPVETATDLSKDGIVLARLTDPEVRPLLPGDLREKDLSERDLGEQGYVVSVQSSRIVVVAFDGQGLFYG